MMIIKARSVPFILSVLLKYALFFEASSAFTGLSTTRLCHVQQSSILTTTTSLPLAKADVLVTNTTNYQVALASEFQSKLPMRQQVLKIQSRLKEIHELNAKGETLTRK